MLEYNFGPRHPLRIDRAKKALDNLLEFAKLEVIDPGVATREEVLKLHAPDYIQALDRGSSGDYLPSGFVTRYGLGTLDTPTFPGMLEAALSICGGAVAAARAVNEGAPLAFNLAGGLHHAQRSMASGFCLLNDPAVSVHTLLERYERVMYVDIDVHHGDGVEDLFLKDPRVLTYSIHQMTPGFYPGTGRAETCGAQGTALNMPLPLGTTHDVWIWAFEHSFLPAVEAFAPQAIVLQTGADSHRSDPLAGIENSIESWLQAVRIVRDTGLPLVVCGGGGYDVPTTVRMWSAAVFVLAGNEEIPPEWVHDEQEFATGGGMEQAERALKVLESLHFPHLGTTLKP